MFDKEDGNENKDVNNAEDPLYLLTGDEGTMSPHIHTWWTSPG